jgi:hypothetical protein
MSDMPEDPGPGAADDVWPGTTVTLTDEGWEQVDYMAPDDDWTLEDDGAWVAPDGRTRTWLPGTEPPT